MIKSIKVVSEYQRLVEGIKSHSQTAKLYTDRAKRLNKDYYAKAETAEECKRWHKAIMEALAEAARWSRQAEECRAKLACLPPVRRG